MKTLTPEPRPWEALLARGAHCVLCRPDKRAVSNGWQKTKPSLEAVIAHAKGAGHVGVIPSSLGCTVIDIDEGADEAFRAVKQVLGTPVTWTRTKRDGGFHMWYRDPSCSGNRKWALAGGAGDVRSAKGYVVLWDVAKLVAGLVANFDNAAPVDLSLLPKPKRGSATGPEAVAKALPGGRNDTLNREAYRAASRGTLDKDEPALRKAGLGIGLEPGEIDATIASAKASAPVFPKLDRDALARALALMNIELRHNTRRHIDEVRNGGDWHDLTDLWAGHIRCELETRFQYETARGVAPLAFGENKWTTCVNGIMFSHASDPFADYLEALPEWDGIERVGHCLNDCFEVDPQGDPDLTAWASQFVFLGPVWRAFRPGTKLDEIPVLSGKGGIGKSTALRLALPQHLEGLFGDELNLAARNQDRVVSLQGPAIVEVGEMVGVSRADLESLKSFLTRVNDGSTRLAYRKNPEPLPRRCVIIGTTNQNDFLPNDVSGNRRFVVIRLVGGDVKLVVEYLETHRTQLWAEAVALYRKGVEAWLPRDLAHVQSVSNEDARRRDDLLEDVLDRKLPEAGDSFTLASIAALIGLIEKGGSGVDLPMRDTRRLGLALTARGFERRVERQDGKTVRIWRKG